MVHRNQNHKSDNCITFWQISTRKTFDCSLRDTLKYARSQTVDRATMICLFTQPILNTTHDLNDSFRILHCTLAVMAYNTASYAV